MAGRWPRESESWSDWRWHLLNRITTVGRLAEILPLTDEERAGIERAAERFPFAVTPYYADLIDPDDPACPIRRQVIPSADELADPAGMPDPLNEDEQSPVPGVVRIYPDRVALLLSETCSSFCRFCYRKRLFDPATPPLDPERLAGALDWLRRHGEIRDVLVTGGDPLMLDDEVLGRVLAELRAVESVEIIRIGTRMPVVLPQRITPELCSLLERFHPLWLNTHFNHPRELTPEAAAACDRLLRAGIPVGNQSVLLRGVNDDVETMRRLVHGLVKMRVRPYYLFQCHLVEGTGHFRTDVEDGVRITAGLRGHTSGLANPLFIVDTPHGKVPLLPWDGWIGREGDDAVLQTYEGKTWREFNPRRGEPASGE